MLTFPRDFMWGCATASYQIEGSPMADGAGDSIWHRFSHTPGTTHNGETGDITHDHYNRYLEDIALMKDLGLRAYRMSIAWPRIYPEGTGRINQAGLDFYESIIDALLEAEIVPFVTIYHWDLPGALQDRGGWANREIVDWFGQYAQTLYARFGDRITNWITINEPSVVSKRGHLDGTQAPGLNDYWAALRVSHNLMMAHGRAVHLYRASGGDGQIGITVNITPQHPASDSTEDIAAAERNDAFLNRAYLDPIFKGSYPDVLPAWFGEAWPNVRDDDLDEVHSPIDFLGVNYYTRQVTANRRGAGVVDAQQVEQTGEHTLMGWEVFPDGLHESLSWVRDTYGDLPLYVTESGSSFEDSFDDSGAVNDDRRLEYLQSHFSAAHRAIQDGVDLRGYFVWTFIDNFEWAFGYSRPFGLVHCDFETQERTIKRSGHWYRDVIANNGL